MTAKTFKGFGVPKNFVSDQSVVELGFMGSAMLPGKLILLYADLIALFGKYALNATAMPVNGLPIEDLLKLF